jgi:HPt (histidine-containing phosphotransfer) domain-containing protein
VERPVNQPGDERAAAIKARMIDLAARFVVRSASDLELMRASLAKLSSGDAAGLEEIRHLAHRMCGTGATLGFEALSDCALQVEKLADELSTGPAGAAQIGTIEAALNALGAQVACLQR